MPRTISPHPPPERLKSPAVPPEIESSAPREVFMPAYGSTGGPHTQSEEYGGNDQLTKPGDTEIAERKDPAPESRFNPSDRGAEEVGHFDTTATTLVTSPDTHARAGTEIGKTDLRFDSQLRKSFLSPKSPLSPESDLGRAGGRSIGREELRDSFRSLLSLLPPLLRKFLMTGGAIPFISLLLLTPRILRRDFNRMLSPVARQSPIKNS